MIRPTARAAACALLSSRPPSRLSPGERAAFVSAANAILGRGAGRSPPVRSSRALFSAGAPEDDHERICSARGRAAPGLLPVYLTDARAVARYDPENAPEGALQLSVAENQMLEDLLVPAISGYATGETEEEEPFYADQIYYQPTHGRPSLREAMAGYLRRILKLEGELDVDGLVLGAGCNAVLENLCLCLAEPGDAVLIPTPYYAAFEFDLVARAALTIVPVNTMAHSGAGVNMKAGGRDPIPPEAYYPTCASLDAAYDAAAARGSPPKVLLLSHPNNPLGVCYPPSVVRECVDWGRERRVHVISDEIYAGSVHGERAGAAAGEETFVSALALAGGHGASGRGAGLGLGPYVHFVYALSKDFALSGLRVGAAYSENEAIRLPMQKLNDLCQISSQTQLLVERMLSSASPMSGEGFWSTDDFLPENCRRIQERCNCLERCLDESGIPHLVTDSGLFVWMDMREFLPPIEDAAASVSPDGAETQDSMERRERSLYLKLLNEHGLLFTPGLSMRNELPGFFRCVFTAASDHEFNLGLERITKSVAAMRMSQ